MLKVLLDVLPKNQNNVESVSMKHKQVKILSLLLVIVKEVLSMSMITATVSGLKESIGEKIKSSSNRSSLMEFSASYAKNVCFLTSIQLDIVQKVPEYVTRSRKTNLFLFCFWSLSYWTVELWAIFSTIPSQVLTRSRSQPLLLVLWLELSHFLE